MAARIRQAVIRAPEGLADEKAVPALPQPNLKRILVRDTSLTRLGLDSLQTQDEHTYADQPLHERLLRGSRLAKRNPRLASLKVGA